MNALVASCIVTSMHHTATSRRGNKGTRRNAATKAIAYRLDSTTTSIVINR